MKLVRASAFVATCALLAGVAGCRQDEQGRPLQFEPGKYQGQTDQKLDAKMERELQQRAT